MTIPSSFASSDSRDYDDYYGKDRYYDYKDDYAKDPYAKDYKSYGDPYEKKYPFGKDHDKYYQGVSIQKIKCVNFNLNINGVDVNQVPGGTTGDGTTEALQGDENGLQDGTGNGMFGDGGINVDRNLVNICVNFNHNGQIDDGHHRPDR